MGVDVVNVAKDFCQNEVYMEILRQNKCVHLPERIVVVSEFNKCSESGDYEPAIKVMSEAFERISNSETDARYLNLVWIKFINIAGQFCNTIPDSLMEYVRADNYQSIYSLINNLSKSNAHHTAGEIKNYVEIQLVISRHILENYDCNDVPALLWLGKYYQNKGDFAQAESIYEEMLKNSCELNTVSSLGGCYENHAKALYSSMRRNDFKTIESINELNGKTLDLYKRALDNIRAGKYGDISESAELNEHYVSITCKYARLNMELANYHACFAILAKMNREDKNYYRILVERGLLYQRRGKRDKHNPYYSLEKAIRDFADAYDMLNECYSSKKQRISSAKCILVPWTISLLELGRVEEAEKNYNEMVQIDKKDPNTAKLGLAISKAKQDGEAG